MVMLTMPTTVSKKLQRLQKYRYMNVIKELSVNGEVKVSGVGFRDSYVLNHPGYGLSRPIRQTFELFLCNCVDVVM